MEPNTITNMSNMNTKYTNWLSSLGLIFLLTLCLFLSPAISVKANGPPAYHSFWGNVTTTKGIPAVGVQVAVVVNGEAMAAILTTDDSGQYGDPDRAIYLVATGAGGDTITFQVSGAAAQITRLGVLVDEELPTRHWEWQVQNPPLQSIAFNPSQLNGADLVYEIPAIQDTTAPAPTATIPTQLPVEPQPMPLTISWGSIIGSIITGCIIIGLIIWSIIRIKNNI